MKTSSKNLRADERREVTVETVVELAGEQNPSEITTAAIAKRMGVTQGALFRHFPNKEAILSSVMEWVSKRLLARIDKAISKQSSPMAALEAMFMAHVDFVCKHPGVPRMLFGELQAANDSAPKRMVQLMIEGYSVKLKALLDEGIQTGDFDAELDTQSASLLFIGTIQGLVMQSLLAGDVKKMRKDAPGVFAIYQRGIRGDK
ncbi:TetR/AcrR family transcriptional regulator [Kangiella koreensis]|uniref:Transcriptional regulator, TetR family n=1 Tax=Kangiella koreensis (strain DSM 16069 / JCM 12317 / KCTC 12182 / SW-125) TaxID=523791 RepID=C7R6Y7_KANKD|nr:TetR family transcriptional regulator [Kangiella koreensis]ACV27443.1 transcriptional regulator, TetR family [Kangiella koreensis DSM 16069]